MSNPQPQSLQQKMKRLGWGGWIPTPDVTDEDKTLYITLGDQHVRIMSCDEALALPDAQLQQQIEQTIGMTFEQACERYGVGHEEIIERDGESYYQSLQFVGFAELLYNKLSELGLVAIVDVRNFGQHPELMIPVQSEMIQLTKKIFAESAYMLACHTVKYLDDDVAWRMGKGYTVSQIVENDVPDMTEWPKAKEQAELQ